VCIVRCKKLLILNKNIKIQKKTSKHISFGRFPISFPPVACIWHDVHHFYPLFSDKDVAFQKERLERISAVIIGHKAT